MGSFEGEATLSVRPLRRGCWELLNRTSIPYSFGVQILQTKNASAAPMAPAALRPSSRGIYCNTYDYAAVDIAFFRTCPNSTHCIVSGTRSKVAPALTIVIKNLLCRPRIRPIIRSRMGKI